MGRRLPLIQNSRGGHPWHQVDTIISFIQSPSRHSSRPTVISSLLKRQTRGSTVKLFTDDSLLYRKIHISNKRDCIGLQQDLDRLLESEKKWQMAFNTEKCEVLCITNRKHPIQHSYFIHGQKPATKTESKYLGLTISSNLSWSKHVNNISNKANSTMAFLRQNIRSASQQAKCTAYKTFVRLGSTQ